MRKLMYKKLNKKGFTILELLVVVAIIAVLAVIAVPQFLGAIEKSRVSAQIADLTAIDKACIMYNFDNSTFPITEGEVTAESKLVPDYINAFPAAGKWDNGDIGLVTDAATCSITVAKVPVESAKNIDKAIDQTEDATGGRLTYTVVEGEDVATITYIVK